ncbi:hypothetical protein B0A58_06435 [Flavobacterium branchiophilum NBRC 15030 = ATCC 35035]|nr:M15 family metallopeptidase [Flavobacterium branchiophilum]OXA76891.1 hypothetical protein B0A58_06435 [Flavobacterium branchiophilum NBRC 15030 = ATCC 35035]
MKLIIISILITMSNILMGQQPPPQVLKLMQAYPDQIIEFRDNKLFFADKSFLIYDDFKTKNSQELLDNPDVEDQFAYRYDTSKTDHNDAGRVRNELFFKKMYGDSENKVRKNLVSITWCPKLVGQKLLVSRINGVAEKMQNISKALDEHPEWKTYLTNIAGTFVWRKIAGTNRLSNHSFGITIDINIKNAHYWQWDCKCKNEFTKLKYRNAIPMGLVQIFEKNGFIWGGRWKHYDTMHFEYRPELF